MDDGAVPPAPSSPRLADVRAPLPLAANTSLGQIVSARTLENQIAPLLSRERIPREVRTLDTKKLKTAAASPAWNVTHDAARVLCAEVGSVDGLCGKTASPRLTLREVKTAPTLVKYALAERPRHRLPRRTPRRRR